MLFDVVCCFAAPPHFGSAFGSRMYLNTFSRLSRETCEFWGIKVSTQTLAIPVPPATTEVLEFPPCNAMVAEFHPSNTMASTVAKCGGTLAMVRASRLRKQLCARIPLLQPSQIPWSVSAWKNPRKSEFCTCKTAEPSNIVVRHY